MNANQVKQFIESRIQWLGQSGIRFQTASGKWVYIDPFKIPAESPAADYLFLTHSHADHYTPAVVKTLTKEGTRIIVPQIMASVGTDSFAVGEEKLIGELKVKTYPAYNQRGFPHPKAKNWVGYLIEFDGFKLYHAGDTDSPTEIAGMKPDAALLPVMGIATFGIKQGAEAALGVGATITIPMHYGLIPGTKKNADKFVAAYQGEALIFKPL